MISDILEVVHSKCGIDFSCYRIPTAERRIHNRMMALGITDLASYRVLLEQSEEEARQLIERLTIKVSRFYRNAPVFDALRSMIVPLLRQHGRSVRVWSAGCGRGEEAYTLAMLLEEAGLEGAVTATDVDFIALAAAAKGVYHAESACELPSVLHERFLRPLPLAEFGQLCIVESLTSRVMFEQSDLTASPGAAAEIFDLVCCRNVLIYWNVERQRQILRALLAGLRIGGFLCLGEAEWPDADVADQLEPVGARLRVFRKIASEEP